MPEPKPQPPQSLTQKLETVDFGKVNTFHELYALLDKTTIGQSIARRIMTVITDSKKLQPKGKLIVYTRFLTTLADPAIRDAVSRLFLKEDPTIIEAQNKEKEEANKVFIKTTVDQHITNLRGMKKEKWGDHMERKINDANDIDTDHPGYLAKLTTAFDELLKETGVSILKTNPIPKTEEPKAPIPPQTENRTGKTSEPTTVPTAKVDIIVPPAETGEKSKEKTKTFSADDIKSIFLPLFKKDEKISKVENFDIKIIGQEIILDTRFISKKFTIKLQATFQNEGNTIILKSHDIKANILAKKQAEEALTPKLKEVPGILKAHIENTEGRKIEKIEIKEGNLEITFEIEEETPQIPPAPTPIEKPVEPVKDAVTEKSPGAEVEEQIARLEEVERCIEEELQVLKKHLELPATANGIKMLEEDPKEYFTQKREFYRKRNAYILYDRKNPKKTKKERGDSKQEIEKYDKIIRIFESLE